MDILAFPAARVVGRGGGPRVPALGRSAGVEGRELGLERALLEGALRIVVSLVGDPVVAGDLLEGLDSAVGGGEEGIGLHRHVGCEFRDPEGSRFEAYGGARLFAAIGGAGCGGAGFGDLLGVEAAGADG